MPAARAIGGGTEKPTRMKPNPPSVAPVRTLGKSQDRTLQARNRPFSRKEGESETEAALRSQHEQDLQRRAQENWKRQDLPRRLSGPDAQGWADDFDPERKAQQVQDWMNERGLWRDPSAPDPSRPYGGGDSPGLDEMRRRLDEMKNRSQATSLQDLVANKMRAQATPGDERPTYRPPIDPERYDEYKRRMDIKYGDRDTTRGTQPRDVRDMPRNMNASPLDDAIGRVLSEEGGHRPDYVPPNDVARNLGRHGAEDYIGPMRRWNPTLEDMPTGPNLNIHGDPNRRWADPQPTQRNAPFPGLEDILRQRNGGRDVQAEQAARGGLTTDQEQQAQEDFARRLMEATQANGMSEEQANSRWADRSPQWWEAQKEWNRRSHLGERGASHGGSVPTFWDRNRAPEGGFRTPSGNTPWTMSDPYQPSLEDVPTGPNLNSEGGNWLWGNDQSLLSYHPNLNPMTWINAAAPGPSPQTAGGAAGLSLLDLLPSLVMGGL